MAVAPLRRAPMSFDGVHRPLCGSRRVWRSAASWNLVSERQHLNSLSPPRRRWDAPRSEALIARVPLWRKRTLCRAERSPQELQQLQEKFQRFREAVERNKEPLDEETLRYYIEGIDQLKNEFDDVDLALSLQSIGQPSWIRALTEINYDFSIWLNQSSAKMRSMLDTKKKMPYDEFVDEMIGILSPRLQSIFSTVGVLGNALASASLVLLFVWACTFLDIQAFENFRTPSQGWGSTWMLWTAPHAIATYLIWKTGVFDSWRPLKGFKKSSTILEFRRDMIPNLQRYNETALILKALGRAWTVTVMYQGVVFGLFQGLLSGEPASETVPFGGVSSTSPLPPILRLPVELLMLCSFSGVVNVLADLSLVMSADEAPTADVPLSPVDADPRAAVTSLEDFELLTDEQITQQRAWWTFVYHFMNVGYLSVEAIAMKSLYTSMVTLLVGYYIMFKGMQQKSA